jgi:hypothetical protein
MGVEGLQFTFDRDYEYGPNLHQTIEHTREHITLLEIEPKLLMKLPIYLSYLLRYLIDNSFFNDKINISVLIRNNWVLFPFDDNPNHGKLFEKKKKGRRIEFSKHAKVEDLKKLWITPDSLVKNEGNIFQVYGKVGTQFKLVGAIFKDYRKPSSREVFFISEKKILKFTGQLFFIISKMLEIFEAQGNIKIKDNKFGDKLSELFKECFFSI